MSNLAKAILAVMKAVKGIDKTLDVGTGQSSYKGVADKVVKQVIGDAMVTNGLVIMPIGVEANAEVSRWEETDPYSKATPKDKKTKQSVFTEVTTKYLLMHESGESMEVAGYGHGVDSQDKSAGKATTYALKNTLLYLFMVPTGKIDDTDNEHSDDKDTPPVQPPIDNRPWITEKMYLQALAKIKGGDKSVLDKTLKAFQLTESQALTLKAA